MMVLKGRWRMSDLQQLVYGKYCVLPSKATVQTRLLIRSPFDCAFDVVSLAKEREPVIQNFLIFVRQVVPVWPAIFRFQGRLRQGAGRVLARKYWIISVSTSARCALIDVYTASRSSATHEPL